MKIAALILAGGKSTRMGEDKGLKKKYGNYWVELISEELPASIDCFISVGKHNIEAYKSAGFENLILDKDGLDNFAGPIKGVLSGIEQLSVYDKLLVIPCDMINLKAEHFQLLLDQEKAAIYELNGHKQPMPFVIEPKEFSSVNNKIFEHLSLQNILELQQVSILKEQDVFSFKNYNFSSDL